SLQTLLQKRTDDSELPAHDENIKKRWPAALAAAAPATPAAAGLVSASRRGSCRRSLRSRCWLCGDQNDLIFLGVQGASFGARLGLHSLFYFKAGRAV